MSIFIKNTYSPFGVTVGTWCVAMGDFSFDSKTIGIWISDKKSQKFNWRELYHTCRSHGYKLLKLDIEKPLEEQGSFNVFLHKLTDIIAAADQGDEKAASCIGHIEQYLSNHPKINVIDPLDKVRILLNRNSYYTILQEEPTFSRQGIFTPTFAEFITDDIENNINIMKQRGVTYPVICKPTLAHGSKSAHEMILIFNEKGLNVCKPPCVVQSFVNHSAVLHKVFVIGNRFHIAERPSLKNFYASDEFEPIFYSTSEVCKAHSQSTLSILDPHDSPELNMPVNEQKIKTIIKVLRRKIGLILFGFDVVINNMTGDHAVIDINVFPSYDNFPNFFDNLLDCVDEMTKVTSDSNGDGDLINAHITNGFVNVGLTCAKLRVIGMNVH